MTSLVIAIWLTPTAKIYALIMDRGFWVQLQENTDNSGFKYFSSLESCQARSQPVINGGASALHRVASG